MSNSLNTYDLIKRGLNAAAVRSETIANNIANVNTSGYKAFKVVFEEKYKIKSPETLRFQDFYGRSGGT